MIRIEGLWDFQGKDEDALPLDLVDELWHYLESLPGKLEKVRPSKEQLGMIINPAYQASLQTEEGRSVRFRVAFNFSADQVTVRFKEVQDYTASHLVKLAPTVGLGTRWIVATPGQPSDTRLKIVGICDHDLTPRTVSEYRWQDQIIRPDGLTLSVLDPGVLRFATQHNALELRRGQSLQPIPFGRIPQIEAWFNDASNLLRISHSHSGRTKIRKVWNSILGKVCNARHGGCFLVVPDTFDIPGRYLNIKYPVELTKLQEAIQGRLRLEPALTELSRGGKGLSPELLYDAHFLERDMARISDLVAGLAAVDGAVIVTRSLKIVGYGAEILLTEPPEAGETVIYSDGSKNTKEEPLSNVGMRHRSAFRFCSRNNNTIALVISQDGGMKVFWSGKEQGKAIVQKNVFPDEWFVPT
jgi:hypothetical protein